MKCIYEEEELNQIAIGLILNLIDRLSMVGEERAEEFLGSIEHEVLEVAARAKHHTFIEESEWRGIIHDPQKLHETCFRVRGPRLVPYLKVPIVNQVGIQVLDHTILGPGLAVDDVMDSLGQWIDESLGEPRHIKSSAIPYRV